MQALGLLPLFLGLAPLAAGIALIANYRGFRDKLARAGAQLGVEVKNAKLLHVVGVMWIFIGAVGTLFGVTTVVNTFE